MNPLEKVKGPCVILAGAGTGKTFTMVEKIKYLIKNKVYSPEKIVCITFSNEAANSLKMRVHKALELSKEPIVRTFHSFSADLLRQYGDKIGVKGDFKILEPDDAKIVLHKNLRVPPMNCHAYVSSISTAKDLGISIEELEGVYKKRFEEVGTSNLEATLEALQFDLQTIHLDRNKKDGKKKLVEGIKQIKDILALKKFISAWKSYEKIKSVKNYLDYSDLNREAFSLLKKYPDIAFNYDYLVVDEFQDTNKIQLDILIALAHNKNITVVGDMNQSIYRFRGAYKDNYELFKKHFNICNEDIFALDKSRRSPNKVLRAAHDLIFNNYSNPDELFRVENFQNREGDEIRVFELLNSKEEARKVAELVEAEIDSGTEPEEICVIFRTHQQGRIIKKVLEARGIAHVSVTKNSLLKHSSVKIAIAYLTLINKISNGGSGGDGAIWDIIHELKFPDADRIAIGKFLKANREDKNICEKMMVSYEVNSLTPAGRVLFKSFSEKLKLMGALSGKPLNEIVSEVYRIGGLFSEDKSREGLNVMANLQRFLEVVNNYSNLHEPDLSSFLHYLSLLENLGIEIDSSDEESGGVRLMTAHSTKGLEYKLVILTNMAQGRFPMSKIRVNPLIPPELLPEIREKIKNLGKIETELFLREYEEQNQIFDERRLCYVAFTRAKEKLILTYAKEYGDMKYSPSQFLSEINYLQNPDFIFESDLREKFVEGAPEIRAIASEPNSEEIHFSPSALLLFKECAKKYEYKYVYNMPEKKTFAWDAMRLGSFVHIILDEGVSRNFRTLKDFVDLAREKQMQDDWQSVNLEDALLMIKVFFERNHLKYDENSKTELLLKTKIGGFNFVGFADRIDERNGTFEIIDYKTGKTPVSPKHRDWQLGYYAIASRKFGKVKKLTLEMLQQEKPIEFIVDESGIARAVGSSMFFNINEVEKEIVSTAKEVLDSYKQGFKPCPVEKNCAFCNEFVYGR